MHTWVYLYPIFSVAHAHGIIHAIFLGMPLPMAASMAAVRPNHRTVGRQNSGSGRPMSQSADGKIRRRSGNSASFSPMSALGGSRGPSMQVPLAAVIKNAAPEQLWRPYWSFGKPTFCGRLLKFCLKTTFLIYRSTVAEYVCVRAPPCAEAQTRACRGANGAARAEAKTRACVCASAPLRCNDRQVCVLDKNK